MGRQEPARTAAAKNDRREEEGDTGCDQGAEYKIAARSRFRLLRQRLPLCAVVVRRLVRSRVDALYRMLSGRLRAMQLETVEADQTQHERTQNTDESPTRNSTRLSGLPGHRARS
ncbi:hypothetical protein GCM10009789_38350 [Kribbella sancticallisti]|uniref:Uncharacterized protein n=1 Tax=Kribbella sancticallisti TaxID=460087 RepID=A0ABN2DMP9_9ACTN